MLRIKGNSDGVPFCEIRGGCASELGYKWRINIVLISFPFFLLVLYFLAWFCFVLPSGFCLTRFMVFAVGKKRVVAVLRSILCVKFDTWVI